MNYKIYILNGQEHVVYSKDEAVFKKAYPNAKVKPSKDEQYQYQVGDSTYHVSKDDHKNFIEHYKDKAKLLKSPEFKPKYSIGVDGGMQEVSKRDILNALYDKEQGRSYIKRLKKGELKIHVENDDAFEGELEKLIGNKNWWTGELTREYDITKAKDLYDNRYLHAINKWGEGFDWVKGQFSTPESGDVLPGHDLSVDTLNRLYPEAVSYTHLTLPTTPYV